MSGGRPKGRSERSLEVETMESQRACILLVEDDPSVLSSLQRRLTFEGYRVEAARTGLEGLEKVSPAIDLVVTDVMLPGLTGLELTEKIRQTSRVPILMLTARDAIADRVAGFERGADDYLVKPFATEELLARIRALLRRAEPTVSEDLVYQDLRLTPSTHEVFRGQNSIALSAREFDLLHYLIRHPRQVLTREQIFEAVWGSDHLGESNVIDVHIKTLRQKLEAQGEPRLIQTLRGVGYSLREA